MIRSKSLGRTFSRPLALLVGIALLLIAGAPAFAADLRGGWGNWWLPPDRSEHGAGIDSLFVWTFWITMVTFIAVEICLLVFLIKYRHRPDKKKAVFTHGNTKLEMTWTLLPAVILAGLAVANKGVWDRLRFNPDEKRADKATILVIGQQFKWNVIYPGPDGKLGRYLMFPKPTDPRWPKGITYEKVKGPAELKYDDAMAAIKKYADTENPLGKDWDDPNGNDDNFSMLPGRDLVMPGKRPVEVQLGSKDVIHSFFMPNHRVKLDAVPGMRGKIVFTATMTSREREEASKKPYKIDQLLPQYNAAQPPDLYIIITKDSPGAVKDPKKEEYLYQETDPKTNKPRTIVRGNNPITKERLEKLKAAGVAEIVAMEPGHWELVCEELCGQGHSTMQARVVVLDSAEYNKQFEGGKSLNPATRPTNIAVAQ